VAQQPSPAPAPNKESPSPFALSVYALLSSTQYNVNFPTTYGTGQNGWSSSAQWSGGAAILPSVRLAPNFEVETGLIYFQRSFNVTYNNGITVEPASETYTALEVPVMFHYWILNFASIGLGAYDLFNPSGSVDQNTFGGPSLPDSNLNGGDFGFIAGLGLKLKLTPSSDLMFKFYYNYSAQNLAAVTSSPQQVFTDMQFLLGLRMAL
jgi:hypothetical protein